MKPARSLAGLAAIGAALIATAGCTAHAGTYAYAETAPVVYHEPPMLVYVDSGVWVVRDSPYPVYYVNDAYWVYRDDVWYHSDSYADGWARVDVHYVPTRVLRRDHRRYVHYRGAPSAPTTRAPRRPALAPASRIDRAPRRTPARPRAEPGGVRQPPRVTPPPRRSAPDRAEPRTPLRTVPPARRSAPPTIRSGPPVPPERARPALPPKPRVAPPAKRDAPSRGTPRAPKRRRAPR